MFVQKFVSEESVKKIPVKKTYDEVESIRTSEVLSAQERELKKRLLIDRQRARIYRKKIESFVAEKFNGRNMFLASEIPVQNRKDFEKLIYIRLFALGSKVYYVKKTGKRVKTEKCEFTDFEIIRKNKKETVNV